jgi:hypothetical protein
LNNQSKEMPYYDDSLCYYSFIKVFKYFSSIKFFWSRLLLNYFKNIIINEACSRIKDIIDYFSIKQFSFSSTVSILQWSYSSSSFT